MNRVHLFEFGDLPWFPDVLRNGTTDYLQYAANRTRLYETIMPIIKKGLIKSGGNTHIDLCSGGGGGILNIHRQLRNESMNIQIILTDKFPNLKAFENVRQQTDGAIQFISESVDATDIPDTLHGFRTLFVSFHHFRPEIAKRILANSVDSGSVIGIFEATERSLMNFIAVLTTPLVVMLAVPFIKPFSFSRLIFTYLIPAIPLFTTWDGIVSVLRTYSVREMKEMTGQIGAKNYIWEIGKVPSKIGPNLLYLLGYPSTAPGGQ